MRRSCVREVPSHPIPPRVRRHASVAQIPREPGGGFPEHARGSAHDATVAGLYRRFAGYSLDIRTIRTGDPPPAGPEDGLPTGRRPASCRLRGDARHRSPFTASRPAPAPRAGARPAGRRKLTGRLTGFHTPTRLFSANFRFWRTPCRDRPQPRSTCTERTARAPRTLRALATATRRTSLHGARVQRFVIECFTPSCQVDNAPSAELATGARRDTVDSILTVLRRGTRAGPRGNVQERHNRGAATTEGA